MKKIINHLIVFAKSVLIGATLRVPGMSGGTMAIILRIYDELLGAVNNFFKNVRKNLLFLSIFAVGGGLAFLAFNSLVYSLTSRFAAISAYFIAGIVLFGIPALLKEADITYTGERFLAEPNLSKNKKIINAIFWDLLPFIAGLLSVVLIGILQTSGALDGTEYSGLARFAFNTLAGFFAGIALVLPGLSFTYFLTVIGLMDLFSQSLSISQLGLDNLVFLATFGVGAIIGLVATAKVLDGFIAKHKRGTYCCIIGFLIGSVIMLLCEPSAIPSRSQLPLCALFFVLGAALILTASFVAARVASGISKEGEQPA